MDRFVTATLAQRSSATHTHLLEAVRDLDNEHLTRWLAQDVPSAGWHLWHIARWADRVHAVLPVMFAGGSFRGATRRELWDSESLASAWRLNVASLGYGQTGMEMGDEAASQLRFPSNDALLDYAQRAFAAADATLAEIGDERLALRGPDLLYAGRLERERTVFEAALGHISHASRHLGTIEGLRALLLKKPGSMTF